MKFNIALATAAILGDTQASALPADSVNTLSRRDPKDKSGNSQFVMECNSQTLPVTGGAGGEGEGGGSNQYSSFYLVAKGEQVEADKSECTYDGYYCNNCLFSGHGLSSPTNVTGCFNAAGGDKGCTVSFKYGDSDYNNEDGIKSCGHEDKGVPFGEDMSAICYFDI